jgi:hypothetical protein
MKLLIPLGLIGGGVFYFTRPNSNKLIGGGITALGVYWLVK